MHHNAKRAMVGSGFHRMHVRHLRHGKERQQDKTHNGNHGQSTMLCAAFSVEVCLQSRQDTCPYLKNTQDWMHSIGKRLRFAAAFPVTPLPPVFNSARLTLIDLHLWRAEVTPV
jgi:hypothetical protein